MAFFSASDAIDPKVLMALKTGLHRDAEEKLAPPYIETPLSILAHDDNGALSGGLTGKTVWNWLYIDILWVDKEKRAKGLGSDLVTRAEALALTRGCHSSYLWTESYQAPEFYKKLGYQQFAVNEDFPVGYRRIGFMKRLAA